MIKNIVFDLGNVLLKDSPSIVLDKLDIPDEIRQNIKNKFFNDWNNLDLGEETVYNTFACPTPNKEQKQKIESTAQKILDIRKKYSNSSFWLIYMATKCIYTQI